MYQNRMLSFRNSSLIRRLAANTASMSTSQIIRVSLNVILSLLVANQLGVDGLGKYAILQAYVSFFQQLTNAGVPRLIVREAARHKENTVRWFSRATVNQIVASIISIILFWGVIGLLSYDTDVIRVLFISALSLIPYAFTSTAEAFFQANENMHFIMFIQLAGRGSQLIGSALLLLLGYDIEALAWMIVAGQIMAGMMGLFLTIRMGFWHGFRVEWRASLSLFKKAIDFNLLQLSVTIFNKLDVLILSIFVDEAMVGIYNAAWLIIQMFNTLSTSFSSAIYPMLSRYYVESVQRFKRFLLVSLSLGGITSLSVVVSVFIFSETLIAIPFRDEGYAASVPILRYLSLFITVFMCNAIMANGLFASNRQRLSVVVATVKLFLGFFIYWILVQQFAMIGAAIATVLTGLIGTVLNAYFLHKSLWRNTTHV